MALRGSPHTLTGTFYATDGGPVEDPQDVSLTILRDGETVAGPIVPPALLRDAPGLFRWVWDVPIDAQVGVYVAAWSGLLVGDDEPSVGYQNFTVTENADPDPGLIVQPDVLARSIGIDVLNPNQREVFTDAILDAQSDVQAYLGRAVVPEVRTERNRVAWGTGWDLRDLGDDDLIRVVEVNPEPANPDAFAVTYLCGLDPANDPALRPIMRFVKAHATNSFEVTSLWKRLTKAKGEVRTVSAEGQSMSWAPATLGGGGGKPGDGTAGSLPTLRSLDRWRVAGRRVHQGPTLSTDRPFMGR